MSVDGTIIAGDSDRGGASKSGEISCDTVRKLVRQLGGDIVGLGFAVELDFLKGRDRFREFDVFSLLHYDE